MTRLTCLDLENAVCAVALCLKFQHAELIGGTPVVDETSQEDTSDWHLGWRQFTSRAVLECGLCTDWFLILFHDVALAVSSTKQPETAPAGTSDGSEAPGSSNRHERAASARNVLSHPPFRI
ncbi:hypothetical protein ISCGN_018332 [Ixodes scapularis]